MMAEIICGDMLRELPTRAVRAGVCIADGPYGLGDEPLNPKRRHGAKGAAKRRTGEPRHNTYHERATWDGEINPEWCRVVCKVAPVVAWFGQWRRREEVARAMRFPLRDEIVWAKNCHAGPPCPTARRDERIWLFSERGIRGRVFETSVWDEPVIPTWARKWHKNEKPLALVRRLLRFLTDPGDLVVDPFAGSCTLGVACVLEGRRFVCIEQSAENCEIGERRIRHARQTGFDLRPDQRSLHVGLESSERRDGAGKRA